MAQLIRWISSSWNIGMDLSSIVLQLSEPTLIVSAANVSVKLYCKLYSGRAVLPLMSLGYQMHEIILGVVQHETSVTAELS